MYYIFCDDSSIERHFMLLSQLEMNKKIFSHNTLIYMCNDDNDMKKIQFFSVRTMWLYQAFICIDSGL